MSQCERNIDCLECSSRGMCYSYAMFKYKQGRANAIDEFVELLKEHIENNGIKVEDKIQMAMFGKHYINKLAEQLKERDRNA